MDARAQRPHARRTHLQPEAEVLLLSKQLPVQPDFMPFDLNLCAELLLLQRSPQDRPGRVHRSGIPTIAMLARIM